MAGFHLYRSASTQALAQKLVSVVTASESQLPLDQDEVIVVQGRGMEQWLSRMAAAKLGVWAGARFPFPRAAAAECAASVLGEAQPERVADDKLTLTFAVAAELPALMERPEGVRVREYLRGNEGRLLSFAQRVANVLDGYTVFRQDVLQAWSAGKPAELARPMPDEVWQAPLWRAIEARASRDGAEGDALKSIVGFWPRIQRAVDALRNGATPAGLSRVSVFAVAGVPPQMVEFFVELGRTCDVHWYAVDPAAETQGSPAPLVASLAQSDLEHVTAVLSAADAALARGVTVTQSVLRAPDAPDATTRLAMIQRHVRTGVAAAAQAEGSAESEANADRSLRLHACVGVQRQAEVLHDEILRALDEIPGLALEEIVVLVPDIGVYAPAIEAVLRSGRGIARIPSSVADGSEQEVSELATAVASALRLADSDMGVQSAMEFLAQPVIAERFLPRNAAAPNVTQWLMEAGARRFLDEHHRAAADVPATREGTWDRALDRLYAGLAAPRACMDAVPGAELFPEQPFLASADALGALSACVDLLRSLRALATEREGASVAEWMTAVQALVERLAPPRGKGEQQARALKQQLAEISAAAESAGFTADVEFEAMRTLVLARMEAQHLGRGFMSGGVTVCQFVPMRAVPFRLVCMLGMNDQKFPRTAVRAGFDLMTLEHRLGDRDQRAEDRALFLQSVMSAGERVVMTYGARDPARGAERAPSTVVSELSEAVPGGVPEVKHPLHSFSVGAFDAGAVRDDRVGYDADAQRAAAQLQRAEMDEHAGRFLARVETEAELPHEVTLDDLMRFFRAPARVTLRQWGLAMPWESDGAADQERVDSTDIEEGGMRFKVLERALANDGAVPVGTVDWMMQKGWLPLGVAGRALGLSLARDVEQAIRATYPNGVQWHEIDLQVNGVRLTGRVPVADGALTVLFSGSVDAKRELDALIQQAAYVAACGSAKPGAAWTVKRDKPKKIPELERAGALARLAQLVAIWRFGIQHGVPFFREHSRDAAAGIRNGLSPDEVADDARAAALESRYALDSNELLLFRGTDPFTEDLGEIPGVGRATFANIACTVFDGASAAATASAAGGAQ